MHKLNVNVCNFPTSPLDKELSTYCYTAISNGTGYAIGDKLELKYVFDTNNPLVPTFTSWINLTTLTTIYVNDVVNPSNNSGTAPLISNLQPCGSSSSLPSLVTPSYSTNRTLFTVNTTPAPYTVATIVNSREITVQNITNADVTITTSQGVQTVATRGVITISNPNNTTVNHNVFTGNITVTFLSSVGGNIGGVQPRIIINQKGY